MAKIIEECEKLFDNVNKNTLIFIEMFNQNF